MSSHNTRFNTPSFLKMSCTKSRIWQLLSNSSFLWMLHCCLFLLYFCVLLFCCFPLIAVGFPSVLIVTRNCFLSIDLWLLNSGILLLPLLINCYKGLFIYHFSPPLGLISLAVFGKIFLIFGPQCFSTSFFIWHLNSLMSLL